VSFLFTVNVEQQIIHKKEIYKSFSFAKGHGRDVIWKKLCIALA
jgi:hypothetical protein